MAKVFNLIFDPTLTRLAGFDFGERIFKEQIDSKFDYKDTPITIVFPDNILKTSSSFVQGFFKKFVELYGYNCIGNQVILKAKSDMLLKIIKENLI